MNFYVNVKNYILLKKLRVWLNLILDRDLLRSHGTKYTLIHIIYALFQFHALIISWWGRESWLKFLSTTLSASCDTFASCNASAWKCKHLIVFAMHFSRHRRRNLEAAGCNLNLIYFSKSILVNKLIRSRLF